MRQRFPPGTRYDAALVRRLAVSALSKAALKSTAAAVVATAAVVAAAAAIVAAAAAENEKNQNNAAAAAVIAEEIHALTSFRLHYILLRKGKSVTEVF